MSSKLWGFFLRDDVESFQRYLANASYTSGGPGSGGGASIFKSGSFGTVITSSLGVSPKAKKSTGTSPVTFVPDRGSVPRSGKSLSRDELNARDQFGRTLLHHVASSPKPTAVDFAYALLEVPYVDIYAQDSESGWTALHRALYAGNASIAQALMARDARDAIDISKPGASGHPSGGLIKIKDREGYSPFDVYSATINSRDVKHIGSATALDSLRPELELNDACSDEEDHLEDPEKPRVNLFSDEVYTFGSNKNLNLGVGDQDDRQFPERITLKRPEHLLERLSREYQEQHEDPRSALLHKSSLGQDLPALIKANPIKIKIIAMSKLHTAILTNDPESNLFMCGFGPGGRLGTDDETTRFNFVCIEGGGLVNKKVVSIALGQDHTLAITENGDIFSWGSNKFGQLGYGLPKTSNRDDVPIQTSPRQIFNPFKKEVIIGAAASTIHSVVFSSSGLYTFGKNEGQLGLVDSDARSLEVQTTPRRVGASLLSTPIHSVSAINQATAVLLQNHEVWVFSHYGYSKLSFPLEVNSRFIRDSFMATRYDTSVNRIVKLRAGGDTICALSSSGDVFTAQVTRLEHLPSLTSTTNPSKIRNSLSTPLCVWSVKKAHMAVKDVDVGQDGSIIICTASGSAWRKEKRRKTKNWSSKDYKFSRVPGLSRVVGVCSNAFGAFAVAQRECDVTKDQINVNPTSLWEDILSLSPFNSIRANITSESSVPDTENIGVLEPVTAIKQAIMNSSNLESCFQSTTADPPVGTVWVMSTLSEIRIPVHEFILTGRSSVLRKVFYEFRRQHYASVPELLTIEKDSSGTPQLLFPGFDILAILNLAFFLYTDNVLDVWQHARYSPENAPRYRLVRTEVMRIATNLELPAFERAAILMNKPLKSMKADFTAAINDPIFFESGDIVIELSGAQIMAHSQVICRRCPFFDALFYGRSRGMWLSSRRQSPHDKIHVDLKHIDRSVFEFVLRYMYADIDDRLFDEARTRDTEDFVDLIIDVAFVANELMIDRLAQICQRFLGKFVTSRNVCHLLNSVAPCLVTEFKDAALEYICLNLEDLISNKFLGDLDEHLLRALDYVCHDNQLTAFPISRGRNSDEYIFEKYPELSSLIESDKRRRIDSMRLKSRVSKIDLHEGKPRASNEKTAVSPSISKAKKSIDKDGSAAVHGSPLLKSKHSTSDLMFQMDDENLLSPLDSWKGKAVNRGTEAADGISIRTWNDSQGFGSNLRGADSFGRQSYLEDQMASPQGAVFAQSPSAFKATAPQGKANGSMSPPNSSQAPWNSAVISSSKKPMKDIMDEASESRLSNISLEMSARRESSSTFTSKLSQKERKKIQQQQMQDMASVQQKAKEGLQNPWKIPIPSQAAALQIGASPNINGQDVPSPTPPKSVQKPGMTLRQTVAGAPSPKPSPKPDSPATSMQAKGRSVSASTQPLPQPSNLGPSPAAAHSTSPNQPASSVPTVQSIRHMPRPEPYQTSFHSDSPGSVSLATILMQQQTEKDEIREAATAKHKLQDIQAEQEFQEWWDKESRRLQGLPEAGPEPAQDERDGRGGRGGRNNRGSNQRRRRGKDPQRAPASAPSPKQLPRNSSEPSTTQNSNPPSLSHPTISKTPRTDIAATSGSSRRGGRPGRGGYHGKQREGERA
ncbi:hypothetical protein BDW59DRAFT_34645 [Aspergillus cavernicola]|uniref:BTB domain-containing protein n=1 Tax=Aspergillus cavernicola TaxID=176166 RepID=A0ABR4IPV4_9EURO